MKRNLKKLPRSLLFAALVSAQGYAQPVAASELSDEQIKALLQRVQELEQKVKTLERNQELDSDAAAEKARTAPIVSLGANGLVVRSADTNFVMNIHGYVQADARFYPADHGVVPDTFLLRRVRPIVEGNVYEKFNYRLMLDLGSGTVAGSTPGNNSILGDAYVNTRFVRQAQIQVGKYKAPVGLERLKSNADMVFIETGFPTQLTPNYDLGVMLHNELFNTPVNYAIGVFNGAPDAGSDDVETAPDQGKDVMGRVFAQPFLETDLDALRGLGFGVGGSAGRHQGTLPTYRTPGQQAFFNYAPGVTADGVQYRIDPQFFYYWGPLGLSGEYILSSQKVKSTIGGTAPYERFNNRAWQIQASYFLTGEDNSFKGGNPAHPFGWHGGGWGAFEIAARIGQLTLDDNTFARGATPSLAAAASAREATSWGVGVNWYLNKTIKLTLDYETTAYHGGSAAAGSATASPEHVILSRVQFAF